MYVHTYSTTCAKITRNIASQCILMEGVLMEKEHNLIFSCSAQTQTYSGERESALKDMLANYKTEATKQIQALTGQLKTKVQ